jgi:hypothetical protein
MTGIYIVVGGIVLLLIVQAVAVWAFANTSKKQHEEVKKIAKEAPQAFMDAPFPLPKSVESFPGCEWVSSPTPVYPDAETYTAPRDTKVYFAVTNHHMRRVFNQIQTMEDLTNDGATIGGLAMRVFESFHGIGKKRASDMSTLVHQWIDDGHGEEVLTNVVFTDGRSRVITDY